jgi:hypothetical protein
MNMSDGNSANTSTSTTTSSSITLPSSADSNYWGFKIMVGVSSNDPVGAQIAGFEAGDYIGIGEMAGEASFATSKAKLIKCIVNVVNKIVGDTVDVLTDGAAEPIVDAWNDSLDLMEKAFKDGKPVKQRDAWGETKDGGYATDEGGVLVCLPQAGGSLHQGDIKLDKDAGSNGRLPKYYPQGKAFFPCNLPGGLLYAEASEAGAAYILAYDSNFDDNQGVYNMEVCVYRPSKAPAGLTTDQAIDKILSLPPNSGLINPDAN